MLSKVHDILGVCIFEYVEEEQILRSVQDVVEVIGRAGAEDASFVILPMDRLAPEFFQLRTGLAGEMLQKFVNYRLRVAIFGDFAALASESTALRDFIRESNRGNSVWFLAGWEELKMRLSAEGKHLSPGI